MSQPGPDASKRNKKRKLKQSRPLLEQLPAVPALENGQRKQHKNKRHQQQPQHQHGAAAEQQQEQQQQQAAQPDALSAGNSKFARALGSTDFHTREQGLQALSRWLLHRQSTSELDMLKLWKGIYFCFWHSDKEPVQVGVFCGVAVFGCANVSQHLRLQTPGHLLACIKLRLPRVCGLSTRSDCLSHPTHNYLNNTISTNRRTLLSVCLGSSPACSPRWQCSTGRPCSARCAQSGLRWTGTGSTSSSCSCASLWQQCSRAWQQPTGERVRGRVGEVLQQQSCFGVPMDSLLAARVGGRSCQRLSVVVGSYCHP